MRCFEYVRTLSLWRKGGRERGREGGREEGREGRGL